jgi:hypothetical protein
MCERLIAVKGSALLTSQQVATQTMIQLAEGG